jgi:hypothetical protein
LLMLVCPRLLPQPVTLSLLSMLWFLCCVPACSTYSLTLKMEAVHSFKVFYQTTWHHSREDSTTFKMHVRLPKLQ